MTRVNRIRNKYERGSISVTPIVDKTRENKLRLLRHVMKRGETEAVRIVMKIKVEGKNKNKKKDKRRNC